VPGHGKYIISVLIILVLILTISWVAAAETDMGSQPSMAELRLKVLTMNIHGGVNWYGEFDLEGLARFIESVNPDLVSLQEVDRVWSSRSQFQDIGVELANRLNMFYAFSSSLERNQGMYGNLILSRYPIIQTWSEKLPGTLETRSYVFCQVLIGGVRVNLLNTHLGLSETDRLLQADQVIRFTNQINGPLVLTGDFNGTADDPAVASLTKIFRDLQLDSNWREHGTFRLKDGNIGGRIDYILASPEFSLHHFEIIDTFLSDHLPLVAELGLWIEPIDLSQLDGEKVLF